MSGRTVEEEVDFQPPGIAGAQLLLEPQGRHADLRPEHALHRSGTPTDPILEYDHSAGKCAIIGGYRYRGSRFPWMVGTYFYGDLCTGLICGATESGGVWTSTLLFTSATNISSFGEDEAGRGLPGSSFCDGGAIHRLTFGELNEHPRLRRRRQERHCLA